MSTLKSVQEISKIEKAALDRRTIAERLGDMIATQAGRMWFILAHAVWFGIWIGLNNGKKGFDPFPFSLLTTIVSLEAIFLSLFILMSQNRSSRQAEHRSHLDLQINLLAERENTLMIHMLRALCEKQGLTVVDRDEVYELEADLRPQDLSAELETNLPDSEKKVQKSNGQH